MNATPRTRSLATRVTLALLLASVAFSGCAPSNGTGDALFLNENKFLSSDPGTGSGGVSITFYERR